MKHLRRNAVKEAVDNLPCGVCFFDRNGIVTLCNLQMYRLVYSLTGRDLQSLAELQGIMSGDIPVKRRDKDMFITDDGSVWRFSRENITDSDGNTYTQIVAADVTELYLRQKELERNNRELEEKGRRLRQLSADVIAVTREEETLNMKMRVHDDIGRSVIATRRLLQQKRPTSELDMTAWKNAVRLLKRDNEMPESKDDFTQLTEAAAGIGISIITDGKLPSDISAAYLLICAMRECASNAVRHAGADKLYVKLRCGNGLACAVITNNGSAPCGKPEEGGGLSTLRTRIEKCGGTMTVRYAPEFELKAAVPAASSADK